MDFLDSFLAGAGKLANSASDIGSLYNDFQSGKDGPVAVADPQPKYTGAPENIQATSNDNTKMILIAGGALVALLAVVAVVK